MAGRNAAPNRSSSHFSDHLDALIERWVKRLPAELEQSFRNDFGPLGPEHDAALELIERAWTRSERAYAFDETGLARRRPFYDHLVELLTMIGAPSVVAVLFVDVDGLKGINDAFGHAVGDKAVRTVGTLLRESLRLDRDRPDVITRTPHRKGDDYSVSHYGGDEFVAALELQTPDDLLTIVKRVHGHVNDVAAQRSRGFDAAVPLRASMGAVVCAPASGAASGCASLARTLVTAADEQMYASKRDGRVHVAFAVLDGGSDIDRARTRTVVV
ncbi:MAG TPA: GGDEF domain-containing protein [Vicinamibacterales bacterium]|nr:GGDEF domain-containing protein [Vicinamibacterales bacterium]